MQIWSDMLMFTDTFIPAKSNNNSLHFGRYVCEKNFVSFFHFGYVSMVKILAECVELCKKPLFKYNGDNWNGNVSQDYRLTPLEPVRPSRLYEIHRSPCVPPCVSHKHCKPATPKRASRISYGESTNSVHLCSLALATPSDAHIR